MHRPRNNPRNDRLYDGHAEKRQWHGNPIDIRHILQVVTVDAELGGADHQAQRRSAVPRTVVQCHGVSCPTASVSRRRSIRASSAIKSTALNGSGIVRLASFVAQPLINSGRLAPLFDPDSRNAASAESEPMEIYACVTERAALNAKVRAFIDFLAVAMLARPG